MQLKHSREGHMNKVLDSHSLPLHAPLFFFFFKLILKKKEEKVSRENTLNKIELKD